MDKDVLDRRLEALCSQAMREARAAVQAAPEGCWIAGSEWPVREIFGRLTRDCYQAMVQARADDHATAAQAAFSPCAGPGVAEQRRAGAAGADGRRGD